MTTFIKKIFTIKKKQLYSRDIHFLMKRISKYLFISVLLIFMTSCSGYQKVLKSKDTDAIYNEAMRLYQNKSYSKALMLFDKVAVFVKGTDKEEPLNYHYAQCYYLSGDYVLANYYFRKYAKMYPFNERAEECSFLAALCNYKQSPVYTLDQKPTLEAITALQTFINSYPNSDKIEECNRYIDELRSKLEEKDFNIAMMYYRMEEYKAAIYCLKNVLKDYPETDRKEEIYSYIVKAGYDYAKNSVESKKQERFKEVIENYQKLVSAFPNSKYTEELEEVYKQAMKNI